MSSRFLLVILLSCISIGHADHFSTDKLIAWCIVPFDSKKRSPAQRVQMLKQLGIKRVAYDWRKENIPEFEEEILQYKRNGIEFFAFWSTHDVAFELFKKHRIQPQIWQTAFSPKSGTQKNKINRAVKAILPLVKKTRELGCKLGLYNHGGWGGEPENLASVCRILRDQHNASHVGIVYNFHHGHNHINDFKKSLKLMQPYLLCINLNGMNSNANPKILPIGQGEHDIEMIKILKKSNYDGPIGILDHRSDTDTKTALQLNLAGLKYISTKDK
ncbi:MAG: TIM barrel protein [Verrucomicrobiota bacterium]|nr:TIM barrel protein [Verrucomicrobiota bacterium]MEE2615387.1 TIM barrel protein [Verrucomicrobiota bacterium]